jgi:hypothetical protein
MHGSSIQLLDGSIIVVRQVQHVLDPKGSSNSIGVPIECNYISKGNLRLAIIGHCL